jgi:hypothetical protein
MHAFHAVLHPYDRAYRSTEMTTKMLGYFARLPAGKATLCCCLIWRWCRLLNVDV